ncbi:MAG: hypothetical protein Q7P63_01305 [Verrucomicrobiota bacterium JB022]|nr:hypothetical protein [Verrucomicrobiota bacterium JB022]
MYAPTEINATGRFTIEQWDKIPGYAKAHLLHMAPDGPILPFDGDATIYTYGDGPDLDPAYMALWAGRFDGDREPLLVHEWKFDHWAFEQRMSVEEFRSLLGNLQLIYPEHLRPKADEPQPQPAA